MKWLVEQHPDELLALTCPNCGYIDGRWSADEMNGRVVGCGGCGVFNQQPTQRELHATGE